MHSFSISGEEFHLHIRRAYNATEVCHCKKVLTSSTANNTQECSHRSVRPALSGTGSARRRGSPVELTAPVPNLQRLSSGPRTARHGVKLGAPPPSPPPPRPMEIRTADDDEHLGHRVSSRRRHRRAGPGALLALLEHCWHYWSTGALLEHCWSTAGALEHRWRYWHCWSSGALLAQTQTRVHPCQHIWTH